MARARAARAAGGHGDSMGGGGRLRAARTPSPVHGLRWPARPLEDCGDHVGCTDFASCGKSMGCVAPMSLGEAMGCGDPMGSSDPSGDPVGSGGPSGWTITVMSACCASSCSVANTSAPMGGSVQVCPGVALSRSLMAGITGGWPEVPPTSSLPERERSMLGFGQHILRLPC